MANKKETNDIFDENGYLTDRSIEKEIEKMQRITKKIVGMAVKKGLNGRQFRQLENAVGDFVVGIIQEKRFEIVHDSLLKFKVK